uniref:GNAT family N-acetyltransferase n=1 Tax=Burkholderia anthina TaxID=179879 RepID=UPI0015888BAE|nr:GNAT family N-acetyltransferase [Burkholderia anthina]
MFQADVKRRYTGRRGAGRPARRLAWQRRLAVIDGRIVGCISLHALPLFHANGNPGRITSLVVDGVCRGRGVGSVLMAAAQRGFEHARCVKLAVTSGDRRPDAHRFYARHGFARDGQRLSKTAGS